MRKELLIVCLLLSTLFISAQEEDQIEEPDKKEICTNKLSIFAEYAKVKNYKEATAPWKYVKDSCPALNKAIYTYGEKILKAKYAESPEENKAAVAAVLLAIYDSWVQYFPNNKKGSKVGDILSAKGQTMVDLKLGTDDEKLSVFEKAYTTDAASFKNPKRLYNYFKLIFAAYKNGKVSQEVLFEKYEELNEKFENENKDLALRLNKVLKKEEAGEALTKREQRTKRICEKNSIAFTAFQKNLNTIIIKESTCENLIPLYTRNFEANKTNEIWLNRAANRLLTKECSDDPLFVTIVESLNTLNPTADSSYYLGLLNDKKGNSAEALKYYQASIDLETDAYKKAKTLYKIALKFKSKGNKSKARKYALDALKYNPSLGKAYLMIANLYADSANDCGDTSFNKRAVYWLAANMARKAANVDGSIRKSALKTETSFNGRAPSKEQVFTEGNQGESIKIECWINRSVTVPKL